MTEGLSPADIAAVQGGGFGGFGNEGLWLFAILALMCGGNSYRDGRRVYGRDGGYSYRRRDSRGRYSRADGKDGMMESMKEIMADATTEKEREIIRDAMSKLEKA